MNRHLTCELCVYFRLDVETVLYYIIIRKMMMFFIVRHAHRKIYAFGINTISRLHNNNNIKALMS